MEVQEEGKRRPWRRVTGFEGSKEEEKGKEKRKRRGRRMGRVKATGHERGKKGERVEEE